MVEQSEPIRMLAGRTIRTWLWWLAQLVVCLAALWLAVSGLARMQALLAYAYPHDGLEGTLLYEARLMRAGQSLYPPIQLTRFFSAPYPPVHALFLALFDLIPGPHVFWAGRLVSVVAGLGTALIAALLVRRSGSPWAMAALAAALVISIPPLQLWGTRIKPDVLALLWTSAGLLCGARALEQAHATQPRRWLDRQLALAAIFFTLAFFTKQTALAGPLAVGLALLAADLRDWRSGQPGYLGGLPLRVRTLLFTIFYVVLALGVWVVLDRITDGQYTIHVWWGGKRTAWWSFGLFSKIAGLLGFWWPQMLLAGLAIPLAWQRRNLFVLVCYVLVAPLTLLGAGEQGSHHNHLLETHLALAVAGCAALGIVVRGAFEPDHDEVRSRGMLRVGAPLLACVVVLLGAAQVYQSVRPPDWYAGELVPEDPPERFLNFIRNTPGEILADDTGLLFQAGRDLRYDDPSTMGPAAAIRAWDQSGLLVEIAQRKFSAIILPVNAERSAIDPTGRWTPEMLAAIKANYTLKFRDRLYIYVPR